MLELSNKTNLLEQKTYRYSLQDVDHPNLYPDLFRYLRETDENGTLSNEDKVHYFLNQMGRNLMKTTDDMGYYCTYGDYDEPQAKADGRAFIKKSVSEFEPLINEFNLTKMRDSSLHFNYTPGINFILPDEAKEKTFRCFIRA